MKSLGFFSCIILTKRIFILLFKHLSIGGDKTEFALLLNFPVFIRKLLYAFYGEEARSLPENKTEALSQESFRSILHWKATC